jgi:hypothetical protein
MNELFSGMGSGSRSVAQFNNREFVTHPGYWILSEGRVRGEGSAEDVPIPNSSVMGGSGANARGTGRRGGCCAHGAGV